MKLRPLEDSTLMDDLRDPEFAAAYLAECKAEGDEELYQLALANVEKAKCSESSS